MKRTGIILLTLICLQQKAFMQVAVHSKLHFTSKENNRVSIDSIYYYQFTALDSSNSSFSFSVENLPNWLTYNNAGHSISGKALKPGQSMIDIIAKTADTLVHQRFMLTVYNKETINILTLGNSITNGTNRYNSYRRSLWQLLHEENYNFDFVGSWSSHHMGGQVPDPDFDMDHDGHSGWTAHDMLSPPGWDKQRGNINEWLKNYTPDIVLMELGTNEVFQCTKAMDAVNNISTVIEILKEHNPGVRIFVALIPPLGAQWADKKLCGNDTAYAQALITFNESLRSFVRAKSKDKKITLVDQYSGINPAQNMYDDIHPNDSGEKIMAERWYDAIRGYLTKLK